MYNEPTVLGIVKARLNRLVSDTSLDEYLKIRIEAADGSLAGKGIHLSADSVSDMAFLADVVEWEYKNRDKPDGMPKWLRLARRERWLKERRNDTG